VSARDAADLKLARPVLLILLLLLSLWIGSFVAFKWLQPAWVISKHNRTDDWFNTLYFPLRYADEWRRGDDAPEFFAKSLHFDDFRPGTGVVQFTMDGETFGMGCNKQCYCRFRQLNLKAGTRMKVRCSRELIAWDGYDDRFCYSVEAFTIVE